MSSRVFHSFVLFLMLQLLDLSEAEDIAVYWGQHPNEGSLSEACDTGKYKYINIAFLNTFGNGQTPTLSLASHCDVSADGCIGLGNDIKYCQDKGIKVMLSIGGEQGNYSLASLEDAKTVSDYLWNNFLLPRPFGGDVVLDGIDFDIEAGDSTFLELVASNLRSYSSLTQRKVYLSAAPQCPFPDPRMGSVLDTGHFDYVWVQFYNNPQCHYHNDQDYFNKFLEAWRTWSTSLKGGKLFLGLPAHQDAAPGGGYIPPHILMSKIIPAINNSVNYGGVMLWSRYYDKINGYSAHIQNFERNLIACTEQNLPPCRSRDDDVFFIESVGSMSSTGIQFYQDYLNNNTPCCEVICRNNCDCEAYAPIMHINNITGCQIWLKGTKFIRSSAEISLPVYVSVSLLQKEKENRRWIWLVFEVGSAVIPIYLIFYLCCSLSRKHKAKVDRKKKQEDLIRDIGGNGMVMVYGKTIKSKNKGNTSNEIEIFTFETIAAATNNFSAVNKLGEGGFGPVYKGTLSDHQEVAVKRLSRSSGQGVVEFTNEARLMARLQHSNLVKLLGFCIQRDERILVYEYMSNKSLDFYLFDSTRKDLLDWGKRWNIIGGIAQGLLYLHKYSRLKVIHRDLKASNVLLDDEMNPKISDFGMARIFGPRVSQEKTRRVVGTFGYMAPEYAINGIVSFKTDVFSFGILLLEILSGKRNNSRFHSDGPINLIGYAWYFWNEGRALELIDPTLNKSCCRNEVLRCIRIGLLCVQDKAKDRPTMLDIVSFLSNDTIQLPQPKKPAFFISVAGEESKSPCRNQEHSLNNVTISSPRAR